MFKVIIIYIFDGKIFSCFFESYMVLSTKYVSNCFWVKSSKEWEYRVFNDITGEMFRGYLF